MRKSLAVAEAILLTLCIMMICWGVSFAKAEHDYNRDMQRILPRKEPYSLLETPFYSSTPTQAPPLGPLTEEDERLLKEITDV